MRNKVEECKNFREFNFLIKETGKKFKHLTFGETFFGFPYLKQYIRKIAFSSFPR
jgi:hypothetical protein